MSGSSATGHCSSVNRNVSRLTCTDPTSSVLFDRVIPALTGLDGDMWASQLLTLQTTTTRPIVLFDFTDTAGYVGLSGRLEVVMFNCPDMGISASTIRVLTSSSSAAPLMDINVDITSCDSLVRVCTQITTSQPSITLDFVTGAKSDMVYLAEVTFYAASSASTCPPDTIITTGPPDTIAPPTTALEVPQTVSLTTPVPDSTSPEESITPTGTSATVQTSTPSTTNTSVTSEGSTNTTGSITSVIIPVVVVICVVFMIVGIMAAVLTQWRYHKHKTSHHTALGEGHSHAHTHSHPPPVKMCEETGQVCYSSPPEALGQLSPLHDTYSHIQRDASVGRGGAQSHQGGSNEEGEYSVLSHGNSPYVLGGGGEDSASQLYAQVDKKEKKKKKKKKGTATEMPTLATYLDEERSGIHTLEASTHLYDRVDAHSHTPEAGTTDQLYAQVDKKGKKKKVEMATHPHTPEVDTAIDQLCAQVDKKVKKKSEVSTHPHTPEVDTAIDQLYAQVDKKAKKKKGEVANTQEADTTVEQLYDNEKKEVPVCPP